MATLTPSTRPDGLESELRKSLGEGSVIDDPEVLAARADDWSGWPSGTPRLLVTPSDTGGVARCLSICNAHRVAVVVQGGRTGLAGGAAARTGEVMLALDKLAGVEDIDTIGGTMTVRAGTTLEAAQAAARGRGMELEIDLGARGSCQIGGVIATNAGGIRVIGTGMTRAHVLGLEVVLADGTVLDDMNTMIKNNSGFDLKQLFIGSEGTLGVVTRAVLRLSPERPGVVTALAALATTGDATTALATARSALGSSLSAFEAMWSDYVTFMSERGGYSRPFDAVPPLSVIIEARGRDESVERSKLEALLADGLEAGWLTDATIAASTDQARRIWAMRDEGPAEYGRLFQAIVPFDVSIPIRSMIGTADRIVGDIRAGWPEAVPLTYGHIGDANLHLVVGFTAPIPDDAKLAISTLVYEAVGAVGGAVSAEHGIGQLKKPWLPLSRTPAAIELMRCMKSTFDPANILNPGRVI
ncbi:FAD-binding oxidoreductase [Microbaculum marinum]|uniref:FAD-binding oxidoreductase n=1 Tax=Microbaculum marinum TaxID=1764581 RepID=A0AAW9RK86_9HYPH